MSKLCRAQQIRTNLQAIIYFPGVECTLHLLEPLLTLHSSTTTTATTLSSRHLSSAALNRFLNLVSQLCERRFALTKFTDAAARARLPQWLVRLRHECAHGEVPGALELRDGLEFCARWIVENYWRREKEEGERERITGYGERK